MNRENIERGGEKLELTPDQITNLGLIADSMYAGERLVRGKINTLAKARRVVAPERLREELDRFANGKDEVIRILDGFRRLLADIEIER